MVRIIEPIPPLDAQPPVIHRALTTSDLQDGIALRINGIGNATAHPTVRTQRIDFFYRVIRQDGQRQRFVDEGAGGTGGHTLATRHAGRLAHRQVVIKSDTGQIAFAGTSDDLIALHVITGTNAAVAHDAGVVVHLDHRRRDVMPMIKRPRWEARRRDALLLGQVEEQITFARIALPVAVVGLVCLRIVRHQ